VRDLIPITVFETIQEHLVRVGDRAQSGWEAGEAEEDTLTGHLGGQLQRGWTRRVAMNGERWRWRVRYKKFRGRGRRAFEAKSGADGIIQVELIRGPQGDRLYKGVLFQAKKNNIRGDSRLLEQVKKMEKTAPGCSAVFEYRADGYRAIDGRTYLEHRRDPTPPAGGGLSSLGAFLAYVFLPCESGLRGLYYDAKRKLLLVPTERNVIRGIPVEIGHRITLEVQSD
jgi:hypothetical protein